MTIDDDLTTTEPEIDVARTALVWVDAERASIVRWRGEPVVERLDSGVPPKRPAVGSVRRGPARPFGGGRVPGHGTEGRHLEYQDRFLRDLVDRLADARSIEVAGRGQAHLLLATLLRERAERANEATVVTTRALSRRPSDRQLAARLRKVTDQELPRRSQGRYRRGVVGPTNATGRPTPAAEGRRTLRPAHTPERQEIDQEVESMLADERASTGPT